MSRVLEKERGIILSRNKLHEKDALVHLLCESGKLLNFRVHGIYASKKRSTSSIELCNVIKLDYYDYQGLKLANAKEFSVEEHYDDIKKEYSLLLFISHLLELAFLGAKVAKHPFLYLLLQGSLQQIQSDWQIYLSQKKNSLSEKERSHTHFLYFINLLLLYSFFMLRLLKVLGLAGNLESCPVCNTSFSQTQAENVIWIPLEMSFHCSQCALYNSEENAYDFLIARFLSYASKQKFQFYRDFSNQQFAHIFPYLYSMNKNSQDSLYYENKKTMHLIFNRMKKGMLNILIDFQSASFKTSQAWGNYYQAQFNNDTIKIITD